MYGKPQNIESIKRWKDPCVPFNLNGILRNWNNLMPGPGQNAVFSLSAGSTCSSFCRSNIEKTQDPAKQSWASSGYTHYGQYIYLAPYNTHRGGGLQT